MPGPLSHPVRAAVGAPETALSDRLVRQLPRSVAAAPWRTRCRVTAWWHKPTPDALDLFPPSIRPQRLSLIAWALVQYSDTPVGAYNEIVAMPLPRGAAALHIPFIMVDSLPSIVGGRKNWLLPKGFASFSWNDRSATVTSQSDAPLPWSLSATARPLSPPVPIALRFTVTQCASGGGAYRFPARVRGLARYAPVRVSGHADGPLSALLVEGKHRGTVISHGRFTALPLS